jgi:hypothetical protein
MIFHTVLLVPACLEIIIWINHNYTGEMYPVPHEIMEIDNWTLRMTIWNVVMFLFWAIFHELKYETYQHGDFDTRRRLTARKRLKLVISIAVWGAFGTITMICLWRQWWLETVAWVMVAFVYYRVKKLVIG